MILRRAGGLWALLLVVVVSASVAAWFAVGDLAVEPPRPVETLASAPPTAREIAIAAVAGLVLAAALAALAFATWRGWMRARWWWVTALLVVAASFGSVAVKGLEDPQSTGIAPAAWAMLMATIPVPALMLAGALAGGFHLLGLPLARRDAETSAAERRRAAAAAGAVAGLTAVVYLAGAASLADSARDLNPYTGRLTASHQARQIALIWLALGAIAAAAGRLGQRTACVAALPLAYAGCLLGHLVISPGGLDAWAIGAEVVLAYCLALAVALAGVGIGEERARRRGRDTPAWGPP